MELDILRLGLDKEPLSADLNSQEIERRQQLEIKSLVKAVSELNEFILLNARSQADAFREQSQQALKNAKNLPKEDKSKELSQLRLNVRMTRFHTVEMSWNRIKYINNKRAGDAPKLITDYIKRPQKSYAYSASIFADQPQWVKNSGMEIEKKLAVLRQQAALISNIRENLFRLSRLTYGYFEMQKDADSDTDFALLDELMGADEEPMNENAQQNPAKEWITNSEKCREWMQERQKLALQTIG